VVCPKTSVMMDAMWHLTMLLPSLLAVLRVGAWRPIDDQSLDTLPRHAILGHAAEAQQTLDSTNSPKELTHTEQRKKRSLLSTREEDNGTGMVWRKKNKDKIKNKPGAFCPTEGLDKKKDDGGNLFGWGSTKQKSKLIVTVPYGHNFPKLKGHYGFTTDTPDVYLQLNVRVGSDQYSARTSVEKNTFNPEWNFRCAFPIPKEAKDVEITGVVYDKNSNRQDTWLGNMQPILLSIGKTIHWQADVGVQSCGACTINIGVVSKKSKSKEPPWLFIMLCSAGGAGVILLCGVVYYLMARRPNEPNESPKVPWSGGGPDLAGQQWAAPPVSHWGPAAGR